MFTSPQIESPWVMKAALLSCCRSSVFGFFAVVVLELPPPPQPEASRAMRTSAGKAGTRNFSRIR